MSKQQHKTYQMLLTLVILYINVSGGKCSCYFFSRNAFSEECVQNGSH